jgi:hypothetical protein
MVAKKIREKFREGFVEVFPARTRSSKTPGKASGAPRLRKVLDAYAAGAKKSDWQVRKLPGLRRSYHVFGGLGFSEYLLIGPAETTGLWFAVSEGKPFPSGLARS